MEPRSPAAEALDSLLNPSPAALKPHRWGQPLRLPLLTSIASSFLTSWELCGKLASLVVAGAHQGNTSNVGACLFL